MLKDGVIRPECSQHPRLILSLLEGPSLGLHQQPEVPLGSLQRQGDPYLSVSRTLMYENNYAARIVVKTTCVKSLEVYRLTCGFLIKEASRAIP